MKILLSFKGDDVLVDDDIYEQAKGLPWTVMHGVVRRNISKYPPKSEQLNRFVTQPPEDYVVIHLDDNKLNCQRANLKPLSRATWKQRVACLTDQGFRGVLRYNKVYRARIHTDEGIRTVGVFACPYEAAQAYDEEAVKEFGDMALLNRDLMANKDTANAR